MEINTEELCLIYKEIKSNPDSWYQGDWAMRRWSVAQDDFCDTAYCFAGHAVVRDPKSTVVWYGARHNAYSCRVSGDDEEISIATRAAEILGLSYEQRTDLFDPDNGLTKIRDLILQYTGRDPEQ